MHRYPLSEVRRRTDKTLDAWWTVLLVDPVASRLVRLAAPYRWITPNRLTGLACALGAAAAACFAQGGRGWLIAGALLFHVAFVAGCMDGRVARLHGSGSLLGAWFDFMADRLRALACAAALMGGQYARAGQARYLWLAAFVIGLGLLRYLNAGQMQQIRRAIRPPAGAGPVRGRAGVTGARVRAALRARRIRMHVVSGVEFETAVFVVAPLTGWITGVTLVAGTLLAAFEAWLVVRLVQGVRGRTSDRQHEQVLSGSIARIPRLHGIGGVHAR